MKRRLGNSYYPLAVLLLILVAYFPISFQLLALKNDIVQLDLPVKHFISKEIHRGQLPVWMYSWAGGFPLGHLFSWSVYNPVTLLFATLFEYNLAALHLEYLCYLIIGAAGIYKIGRKIFHLEEKPASIAALVYALSGITVSCSQFLAYLASIAFLPWLYYCFISLVKKPSLQTSLHLALAAFMLVSWSYPAGVIISFYSIIALALVAHFAFGFQIWNKRFLGFLFLSVVIIIVLSLPLLYNTLKTLPFFSRSEKLAGLNNDFGYLHPSSLLSFFNPFYNISISNADTTFLFQNVYIEIVAFSLLLAGLLKKQVKVVGRKAVLWLLIGASIAIVFSFGDILFIRKWINEILPGFKWFRFPSFFRIFFLICASILIGIFLTQKDGSFQNGKPTACIQKWALILCCTIASLLCLYQLYNLTSGFSTIDPASFLSSKEGIQKSIVLIFLIWTLVLILLALVQQRLKFGISKLIAVDLVFTALLSLPIYAVSNYTPQQLKSILKINSAWSKEVTIDRSSGVFTDSKGNPFNGLNVYANKINVAEQYWGPLHLKTYEQLSQSRYVDQPPQNLIFLSNSKEGEAVQMQNSTFENYTFSAQVRSNGPQKVILFQLAFPFWKAFVDGRQVPVLTSEEGLVYIDYEGGQHEVKFEYQDSLLSIFNLVFFITFPALILAIILFKRRRRNV